VETKHGVFSVNCAHDHQPGGTVRLLVRPQPAGRETNTVQGVVSDVLFQQDRFKVTLENGLYVYLESAPQVGEPLKVPVRMECLS
jgi:hypothetical protein